jgi:lauroyl/myristoyl acyltransferase
MEVRSPVPTDTLQVRRFLRIARSVAGGIPPWVYLYRCLLYQRKLRSVHRTLHRRSWTGPVDTARLPDNSAEFAHLIFSYKGLDEVKAMIAERVPLVLITWHQGAFGRNYGIARALPETAIFTRETFQYGKVFSHSMLRAKGLSLVKIERFLREGRPVKYSIDGIPLGAAVRLPVMGVPCDLSTAPIRVMRSVEGVRFVPVTAYYRNGFAIDLLFHPPFPPPERLPEMSDREVLEALISFLERDLMEQGPEQIRWRFFGHRERLAKKP